MATFVTFFVWAYFPLSYPGYRSAPKCHWKEDFSLTEINSTQLKHTVYWNMAQLENQQKKLYIEKRIFVCFKVKHICIKYAFAYAKYCIYVYNSISIFWICMRKNKFQCYVNIKVSIKMCSSASSLWLVTGTYITSGVFFVWWPKLFWK